LFAASNILLDCRTIDFQDAPFRRVVADSRHVRAGDVFVCVPGTQVDGHDFSEKAVAAGAAAVVTQRPLSLPRPVPQLIVPDTRVALAVLSMAACNRPSRRLKVIGVTGTNGKTTTTYLVRSILTAGGAKAGLIGTITCDTGGQAQASDMTTPDPERLALLLAQMVEAGDTHAVMEVSSHALDQHRTDGIDFAAAAFTNLTKEHLDYHRTLENYFAAKSRLFRTLPAGAVAAVNADDEFGRRLASLSTASTTLTYGLDAPADVRGTIFSQDAGGTRFGLRTPSGATELHTVLVGRHNVSNCLAAAAVCCGLGVPLAQIAEGLARQQVVPGRLQPVDVGGRFTVLVDYAHTDDALEKVLNSVRPLTPGGGVLLVFGCGGDRDREKRPRMATVAERLADRIFVTNDNPRTESPERIIEQIRKGFSADGLKKVTFEPDRAKAIRAALDAAEDGDIVLIAGKGHEDYQILGRTKIHFDDREVVAEWANQQRQTVAV